MIARETIDESFERYQQLLRAQAELYRTLIRLAKKQAAEIAERNIDGFVAVLEEKRSVLREIESLELSAVPLRHLWESQNHRVDEPVRARMKEVVEEIQTLLEELLKIESVSQRELGIAKESVEEELRQVSTGSNALRSYKGPYQCKPRFMNEIG